MIKEFRIRNLVLALASFIIVAASSFTSEAAVYIPDESNNFSPYLFEEQVEDSNYNVLFIGNSISYHPACQYWWGNWGMAASARDNDYVHQIVSGLKVTYGSVGFDIISYSVWERPNERTNVVPNISFLLTENKYNTVVIQLGENSRDTKTFEADYETLVEYVKNCQPNAKIVLIGDFWKQKGRDAMKQRVAKRQNVTYVDLSDFRDKPEYRSFCGDIVYGEDGSEHTIDFSPVAVHPNDKAMEEIATRTLNVLQTDEIK